MLALAARVGRFSNSLWCDNLRLSEPALKFIISGGILLNKINICI